MNTPAKPSGPQRPAETPADRMIVAVALVILLVAGAVGYFLIS